MQPTHSESRYSRGMGEPIWFVVRTGVASALFLEFFGVGAPGFDFGAFRVREENLKARVRAGIFPNHSDP